MFLHPGVVFKEAWSLNGARNGARAEGRLVGVVGDGEKAGVDTVPREPRGGGRRGWEGVGNAGEEEGWCGSCPIGIAGREERR